MNPGIYHGIPAAEYHALPFVSNSYLKRLAKCPANAHVPQDTTPAMLLGRAAHSLILEGREVFESEFCLVPDGAPKRPTSLQINAKKPSPDTLAACEYWKSFDRATKGRTPITADDMSAIECMCVSVYSHPTARLILAEGTSESTVIFDADVDGTPIRCKCRPDRTPSLETGTLIDLKTTENAGLEEFGRSCLKYGYITQAAFYIDGYNTVRGSLPLIDAFAFIAVEKNPPYRCEVYTVDMDYLLWGRREYQRLLREELRCRQQGYYPNYQNAGAEVLMKPAYLV